MHGQAEVRPDRTPSLGVLMPAGKWCGSFVALPTTLPRAAGLLRGEPDDEPRAGASVEPATPRRVIGASIRPALLLEIMFHHSNVDLAPETERWLARFIVTPRLHGIHHSIVEDEVNSNWSSGLTIWDRLHRTLRVDVPQEAITIGVPAFLDPEEVQLKEVIEMPFVEQRDPLFLPPR